jgi:chromosome segregation ATPase
MKSTLPVPPAAGQQQPGTVPAAAPATCRYPGCGNPARTRAGDGPGAPPRYCGQAVAEDRGEHGAAEVTHTALTAFRRRQELSGADAGGADAGQPVTAAIARAAAIRDDALTAITRLSAQLEGVLSQLGGIGAQLAAAASPEAAEAQIEAVRAQTTADLETARAELARQVTLTHAARDSETEARQAAAQAITAMETARAAQAGAEAAAAAQAETARHAQAQAGQARAAADAAITAAAQAARDQASQLQAEAKAAITAARSERDTALAGAAAATAHAQDARDQLTRLRDDHDRHAAGTAAAHQGQLAALGDTITELRQRLHRAEADTAAERAERQHLTTHLQELTTRPAGCRKAAAP